MPEDYVRPPSAIDRSQHLASLHDRWSTSPEIVASVVGKVTTAPVLDIGRIVAGEQNEVYDVALERSPSMIVRISHGGTAAHEREAWVIGQCESRGIRVPRVHALRHIEVDTEWKSVIVMEKLPGVRLADFSPGQVDVRQVLREVGAC